MQSVVYDSLRRHVYEDCQVTVTVIRRGFDYHHEQTKAIR